MRVSRLARERREYRPSRQCSIRKTGRPMSCYLWSPDRKTGRASHSTGRRFDNGVVQDRSNGLEAYFDS